MANSEKLSKPVAIRWAIVVKEVKESMETIIVHKHAIPMDQATGTPMPSKTKNTMTNIKISTPIAWGELYTALQQGIVDGAENNLPSFYLSRHYEVCKYYTMDEHTAGDITMSYQDL